MGWPPAIVQSNVDAKEIDVTPSSDQPPGEMFVDPVSGRYVIPQRYLLANQLSAALDNGRFRVLKENASDVFIAGDTLAFGTIAYVAGFDPLAVVSASAAGEKYVTAELNPFASGGSGDGGEQSFIIRRLDGDPDILTLDADQLLAVVQAADPLYASITHLRDLDNLHVVYTDLQSYVDYEINAGVAVSVGGQSQARYYHKITGTSADNTVQTASDWPDTVVQLNAILEVEKLPRERKRTELWRWTGGPTDFIQISDTVRNVTATSHGLDLNTTEGGKMPVAWFDDTVSSRAPVTLEEAIVFAVAAPDANTLSVRTSSDMQGRRYSNMTNLPAGVKLGESLFWDSVTNTATRTINDLRLCQVSNTDVTLLTMDIEDTRIRTAGPVSIFDVEEWKFQLTADVAADTEIAIGSFSPVAGTVGSPDFVSWVSDANQMLHAGGNLVSRSGNASTDLLGTATATGISFNQGLALGDSVVIRKSRTLTGGVEDLTLGNNAMATTTSDDATPSVAGIGLLVVNNSGATTITDFDDGTAGQDLRVLILEANTGISDSGDITLDAVDGAYAAQAGGAMFEFGTNDGSAWYEVSRRVF